MKVKNTVSGGGPVMTSGTTSNMAVVLEQAEQAEEMWKGPVLGATTCP